MEDPSAESEPLDAGVVLPRRRRTLSDALAQLDAAQIAAGVPVAQIYGAGLPAEEIRDQLAAVLPTRFVPDDLITWFCWRNGATSALAHHQAVLSPEGGDRLFGLSETIEWYERTIHSFRSLPADDPQALWAGLWGLNLQLWSSNGSDQWFVELRPSATEPLPIQRIMLGDEPMAFRPPESALPRRNLPAYIRHQARAWLELASADSPELAMEHTAGSPFATLGRIDEVTEAFTPTRRGDDDAGSAAFSSATTADTDAADEGYEAVSMVNDRDSDVGESVGEGFGLNLFVAAPVDQERRSSDEPVDRVSDFDPVVSGGIEDATGDITANEAESTAATEGEWIR
ncbi:MAG: hypothetical protein GY929_15135 [Actinomycetia bacterium]|nr:hypothetical protein [Actinomycetes bacterium]